MSTSINELEQLILDFFDIQVVNFGLFKLKSGINSPIYLDLRVIVSHPKILDLLTNLLVKIVQNSDIDKSGCICGVPYTALPMATLVSIKTGIPMLIRRKEAKDHGTRKIIEGVYKEDTECVIIEDVVSSGLSIIETVEDLERGGLKVKKAVVVLDREQGGVKNLEERGIKVYVLTSISKVLNILHNHKKISECTFNEVKQYINSTKISIVDGIVQTADGAVKNRLTMPFGERAAMAVNKTAKKIFQIMEEKKTLLCLAADLTKTAELLDLASKIGPHICIFKTHFDALEDFSKEFLSELQKIAEKHNFLIMEDRKFSDIGNTVSLQFNQIKSWANLITAHSIAGEGIIKGLKSSLEGNMERGCFLVAELSCEGQLINKEYTKATVNMAEKHSDFVIGLVCQSPDILKAPHLIQLTPGVKLEERSDNLGQKYNDPEYVVLEKGADIAVVGRGIILSSNPEKSAILYKEKLWKAYEKRIVR